MSSELIFGVADFIAVLNQTLEFAYPSVTIEGELADLRVSKNRWVYFKLKDDNATLSCFGSVYMLPGPLENGMMVRVSGQPRHHLQYGFSLNATSMAVCGEGSLKKAQDLLQKKLTAEGLFDPERKRVLPEVPEHVGLITSRGSAAEVDFIKIVGERWGGLEVTRRDSLVQGMDAPLQLVAAIAEFNALARPPEVLVIIRGGGSQDDLAAFSDERVVRAVSASRIPTLIAIGHEIDLSLAELAADKRASTPTNAAQLLVPDRQYAIGQAWGQAEMLGEMLQNHLIQQRSDAWQRVTGAGDGVERQIAGYQQDLQLKHNLLGALNPQAVLARGYALIRSAGVVVRSVKSLKLQQHIDLTLADGVLAATINSIGRNK